MTNYTNIANFSKSLKTRSQCILFIILLFIVFPTYSGDSKDIARQNPISVSYTLTNTDGKEIICEISSTDSIEDLRELKNSSCQLSLNDSTEHPLIKLKQKNRNNEKKEILITTRKFLMLAYLAVHVYKAWDSGTKIFGSEKKGCCCKAKTKVEETAVTTKQKGFFAYYIAGLAWHGWSYLSSYIMTPQETQQDQNDSDNSPAPDEEQDESWTDTIKNFTSKLSEYSYSWHILSLARDSAILKWGCDCPGYLFYPDNFKDPSKSGHFYFNGHLWMLLLNVAIFATDLAIDYL